MIHDARVKVIFFGSSPSCVSILDALSRSFPVAAVITRADAPVGRNQVMTSSPPKQFATSRGLPVFTPDTSTKLSGLRTALTELHPDIGVVADYGILIPKDVFSIPRLGTINIHFSNLPQLRGACPIQYTLLLGLPQASITFQRIAETLDTGDIFRKTHYRLCGLETTQSLKDFLFAQAGKDLPGVIAAISSGTLTPTAQRNEEATMTRRMAREDGFVPRHIFLSSLSGTAVSVEHLAGWPLFRTLISFRSPSLDVSVFPTSPAFLIDRVFRALSPWPGVWTTIDLRHAASGPTEEKRLKILSLHLTRHIDTPSLPRTTRRVSDDKILPDTVQLEGKQPVSWKQFVHGYGRFFLHSQAV